MVITILSLTIISCIIIAWFLLQRQQRGIKTTSKIFPQVSFLCIAGPYAGQEFLIRKNNARIGRNPRSDIRLDDCLVSWEHACLAYIEGQFVIYDQDSTNGTWVNGQRIAQCVIRPGVDQIHIGSSVFILKVADQPVSIEVKPSSLPQIASPKAPIERVYDLEDYEIIGKLGSGGVATVYKAISKIDGQVVAIKVLHSSDPYLRDKFFKEGAIGQLLRHPHIVRIYGYGRSQGIYYIVMEYMDGGTLRDRLRSGCPLPFDQVVTIVGQVCDALQYAHKMGIYHRDIKPENIFFSSDGQVKLGDFGIARIAQTVTQTASGWLIGTPAYISYEQAKGHPIDGRSDLYSLGVVIYEMVTGRCPFMADDPLKIIDMHIRDYPVPPSRLNPSVPPHIESVIMRALEKDRERRFRTAEEMARALGYTAPMHTGEFPTPKPAVSTGYLVPRPGLLQLVRTDGIVIPLTGEVTWLNRSNVNPNDLEISRQHARVVQRNGYYWLEDVGSSNGTFLNGMRIFSPQLLQPGDEIRLGQTILRVEKVH